LLTIADSYWSKLWHGKEKRVTAVVNGVVNVVNENSTPVSLHSAYSEQLSHWSKK
jgi:hypothetical protein